MILHVACLPFPTFQGTQAAIASMLRASAEAGRPTHLLAYAHSAYTLDAPFTVHRISDFPKVRSLRSGPSWGKLALDARSVLEIRRLYRRHQPKAIIAHHIEAAASALAAGVAPVYYVAHTSLARELPIYFPKLPAAPIASVGRYAEAHVCARATGVAAVTPLLCTLLGDRAVYLPVPWPRAKGARTPSVRSAARVALGLPLDAPVCLYAGNLDRYQGWEHLLAALRELRGTHPEAKLLIATESDPEPARIEAQRRQVAKAVRFCRLNGERTRANAHAASDLTWIPRHTEGGLPIKMLDAFARGLPVVAMNRARGGLPVQDACIVTPDDDARALAAAALRLLREDGLAQSTTRHALTYLETHHGADAFCAAMRELLRGGLTRPRPTLAQAPPPAEKARQAR